MRQNFWQHQQATRKIRTWKLQEFLKASLLYTLYSTVNSILNFLLLPYTQDLAIPN
jgi:hypothetical protein